MSPHQQQQHKQHPKAYAPSEMAGNKAERPSKGTTAAAQTADPQPGKLGYAIVRVTGVKHPDVPAWPVGLMGLYKDDLQEGGKLSFNLYDGGEETESNVDVDDYEFVEMGPRFGAGHIKDVWPRGYPEAWEHEPTAAGYAEAVVNAVMLLTSSLQDIRAVEKMHARWTFPEVVSTTMENLTTIGEKDLVAVKDVLAMVIAGINKRLARGEKRG